MALTDNIAKMASTLLTIAKCRAELAAIEYEDEWKRLLGYFVFSLAAFFCLFFGVLMVAILFLPDRRPHHYSLCQTQYQQQAKDA